MALLVVETKSETGNLSIMIIFQRRQICNSLGAYLAILSILIGHRETIIVSRASKVLTSSIAPRHLVTFWGWRTHCKNLIFCCLCHINKFIALTILLFCLFRCWLLFNMRFCYLLKFIVRLLTWVVVKLLFLILHRCMTLFFLTLLFTALWLLGLPWSLWLNWLSIIIILDYFYFRLFLSLFFYRLSLLFLL